jgi:hypothetical protein
MWITFHAPSIKKIINTVIAGALLTLPLILFLILPFLGYAHAPLSSTESFSFQTILAAALLIGLIPCLLALAWVVKKLLTRESFLRNDILLLLIGAGAVIGSVFLNVWFPELIVGTKLPALALIGIVLMGAQFLSAVVKPAHHSIAVLLVVLLSGAVMLSSPSMQEYATGSKSTLEEARFASFLHSFDREVAPVLFLSQGVGKMAQYSQKIPSDPRGAHFMLALQLLDTPEARALKKQSDDFQTLMKTKCVSCVDEFLSAYPMKYVVLNTEDFPLLPKAPIYQSEHFVMYAG